MSKEIKLTMISLFCLIAIVSFGFPKTVAEPVIFRGIYAEYIYYSSIGDLCNAADLIVVAKIVKVNPGVPIIIAEHPDGRPLAVVYTVSDIKIEKVIKGAVKPDEIIQIKKPGGTYKGDYYFANWPEQFSKDLRGFFFLKNSSNTPACCLNPTQGFLKLVDGKIEVAEHSYDLGAIEPEIIELFFSGHKYQIFDKGMAENDLLNLLEQNLSS